MKTWNIVPSFLLSFIVLFSTLPYTIGYAGRGGGFEGNVGNRYNADRNGYRGDMNDRYRNGYYNGGYYDTGTVVNPGVVIGVPNGTSCSTVQQCDAYGNCYMNQVCN